MPSKTTTTCVHVCVVYIYMTTYSQNVTVITIIIIITTAEQKKNHRTSYVSLKPFVNQATRKKSSVTSPRQKNGAYFHAANAADGGGFWLWIAYAIVSCALRGYNHCGYQRGGDTRAQRDATLRVVMVVLLWYISFNTKIKRGKNPTIHKSSLYYTSFTNNSNNNSNAALQQQRQEQHHRQQHQFQSHFCIMIVIVMIMFVLSSTYQRALIFISIFSPLVGVELKE